MSVDLHIHTTASDGTLTPQQVVAEALTRGLSAIAIADHDTMAGVEGALVAARGTGLDVFPAVEVSAVQGSQELHVLGYFVDAEDGDLCAVLERIRESRRRRAALMVQRLQELGVAISLDDVLAVSPGESLGRPHVAAALMRLGVVSAAQEAFDRYIGRGRPAYVARFRPVATEAIGLIRRAHGLPVLAHPGLVNADGLLPALVRAGLAGIEAYHVDHTAEQVARYLRLAHGLGLLVTGGSDSHGPGGPTPVDVGQVEVPDEHAEALRAWGEEHGRWPVADPGAESSGGTTV